MAPKPTQILQKEFPRGEAHSFDLEAIREMVVFQGMPLVHYRAFPCPVGVRDIHDQTRNTHQGHEGCSYGYLYREQGTVYGFTHTHTGTLQSTEAGAIDGGQSQATVLRNYESGGPVYLRIFDRLYLNDPAVVVPHYELVEHRLDGVDRLRFPAVKVVELMDNRGTLYQPGRDFQVQDGKIVWGQGQRPGADLDSFEGRGRVYSVYYLYRPYYTVTRMGHDLRMTQAEDETGQRRTHLLPYEVTLTRDSLFLNEERPETGENPRSQMSAPDGSFGPG